MHFPCWSTRTAPSPAASPESASPSSEPSVKMCTTSTFPKDTCLAMPLSRCPLIILKSSFVFPFNLTLCLLPSYLPRSLSTECRCSSVNLRRSETQSTSQRFGFLAANLVCCEDLVNSPQQLTNSLICVPYTKEITNLFVQVKRNSQCIEDLRKVDVFTFGSTEVQNQVHRTRSSLPNSRSSTTQISWQQWSHRSMTTWAILAKNIRHY